MRIETAFAKYLKEQLYHGRPSHCFKASYELVKAISKSSKKWVEYTFNYTDSSDISDFIAQDSNTSFSTIQFTHLHGQIYRRIGQFAGLSRCSHLYYCFL